MNKTIVFLLMDGFKEMEAVIPVDILRRLNFDIKLAGLKHKVTGAHNITFETDVLISNISSGDIDAVVLPGGLPGAKNLRDNASVITLVSNMNDAGKLVAAICAAPIALAEAGIMEGKKCTAYPMPLTKRALQDAELTEDLVVIDGNIITGKGPGAAFEFAFAIASAFNVATEELKKAMFI